MKRRDWLDRLFSLSLYLYPRDFRLQFGEEMREVFRQQCLHQRNRLRLLGELLLDNLQAAPVEHGRAFSQRGVARLHVMMALLCIALAGLALRPQVSLAINGLVESSAEVIRKWEYSRALTIWNAKGEALATNARSLLATGDEQQKAMAALLVAREQSWRDSVSNAAEDHRSAYFLLNGDLPLDQAKQTMQQGMQSADPLRLQVSVLTCAALSACDPGAGLQRLITLDPTNAATWMIAADIQSKSDPEAAHGALEHALNATHYRSFHKAALSVWYADVWAHREARHWWTPHDAIYVDDMITTQLNAFATPMLRSCGGKPADPDLCQSVSLRWKNSVDDFYSALRMEQFAHGYDRWNRKTAVGDMGREFANALMAHPNDPQLAPSVLAARIRESGMLAVMRDVVSEHPGKSANP